MTRTGKQSMAAEVRSELRSMKDPEKARILSGFFKTGPGEYGEGDRFLGIKVPVIRKIAKKYRNIPLNHVLDLLQSEYHEERFAALLILVDRYQHGDKDCQKEIFGVYLDNTEHINSWDLVDTTAPHIVGHYLFGRKQSLLSELAVSDNLWERRIAILSTFYFIRQGRDRETLKIARLLLHDSHDLIHKAVGWMLREVGSRGSMEIECRFLDRYASVMPRTMLRYAVEKFPRDLRMKYMGKQESEVRSQKSGVRSQEPGARSKKIIRPERALY